MLAKLKMLLSIRAWLKSGGLQAGGAVTVLGAVQTWLSTKDGTDVLAAAAGMAHLTAPTLNGLVLGVIGIGMLILRAKSEWSLAEKVAGADKVPPPGG
jgi:hypothetical protein